MKKILVAISPLLLLLCFCLFIFQSPKKMIVCWGDSLTAPSEIHGYECKGIFLKWLDTSYPAQLEEILGSKYEVINKGIRGETSIEILSRRKTYNEEAFINIFFAGQNGGFKTNQELIDQIQNMISLGKSSNYLVLSFHKPNAVFSSIDQIKQMEDSLHLAFGDNFVNVRQSCIDYCWSHQEELTPNDISILSNDDVPPFLLMDYWHFNERGCGAIAAAVAAKMSALGYNISNE